MSERRSEAAEVGGPWADRMFAAIEAGDLEAYRRCLSPGFTSWTNFDDRSHDLEGSCRLVAWMVEATASRRYTEVRRTPTPTGFVQQHVLVVRGADGEEAAVPACIVATLADDGRIGHMEEYLDPTPFARLA